jgi:Kdo2-lipid IVA lauroyltransferase/acyltransferase
MSWLHTLFNYIGLSILKLFAFLPYAWIIQIGYALGSLFGKLPHERKNVVLRNLVLCFPNLSPIQIQTLANEHWRLLGRAVIERSRVWLGSADQVISMVELQSDIDPGDHKPRILVMPHFVGLEAGFMTLSALSTQNAWPKGIGLYQNMKNPFFNQKIIEWRGRFGGRSINRQNRLFDVIREIRRGNIVVIAPDIDLGPKDSVFVPFFGIPTNTITAISRLAKAGGAEVCLMITTLNADKSKYICRIHKALPNFPSDDPVADTARLNLCFEEEIRKRPAEYYWVHKRFKYRPPGEASLYD